MEQLLEVFNLTAHFLALLEYRVFYRIVEKQVLSTLSIPGAANKTEVYQNHQFVRYLSFRHLFGSNMECKASHYSPWRSLLISNRAAWISVVSWSIHWRILEPNLPNLPWVHCQSMELLSACLLAMPIGRDGVGHQLSVRFVQPLTLN